MVITGWDSDPFSSSNWAAESLFLFPGALVDEPYLFRSRAVIDVRIFSKVKRVGRKLEPGRRDRYGEGRGMMCPAGNVFHRQLPVARRFIRAQGEKGAVSPAPFGNRYSSFLEQQFFYLDRLHRIRRVRIQLRVNRHALGEIHCVQVNDDIAALVLAALGPGQMITAGKLDRGEMPYRRPGVREAPAPGV